LEGIAITQTFSDQFVGDWQYKKQPADQWTTITPVSDTSALLLDGNSLIRFVPAENYQGTAPPLSFKAWDRTSTEDTGDRIDTSNNGTSTSISTNTGQINITISPVNDAPILSNIEAPALPYTGASAVSVTNTLEVEDTDSDDNIERATITIGDFVPGEDTLSFVSHVGISGNFDPASGTLTLTGSAPIAEYESIIRSVTYDNSSSSPATLNRTIDITVFDGDAVSNVASRVIQLEVNDSPSFVGLDSTPVFRPGLLARIDANATVQDPELAGWQSTRIPTVNW